MKNAIGAVIILFVVYLHMLVVPPRNLRGYWYKNYEAANQNRTCNYEWTCSEDLSIDDAKMYCGDMPEGAEDIKTETCFGSCLTYTTTRREENEPDVVLFRGRRCEPYCDPLTVTVVDGIMSSFSCCQSEGCNY